MHQQPEPTEQEKDEAPERLEEEEPHRGPGHEDPDRARERTRDE